MNDLPYEGSDDELSDFPYEGSVSKPKRYKRKKRTKRKIATRMEDLKGYNREKLRSIINANNFSVNFKKVNSVNELKKIIIDNALDINKIYRYQYELNPKEKPENITQERWSRTYKKKLLEEYIEEKIKKKRIYTNIVEKKIFETDNYNFFIVSNGYLKSVDKNNNEISMKKITNPWITISADGQKFSQSSNAVFAENFLFGYNKNKNDIYKIDGNEKNYNVNNLLILPKNYKKVLTQTSKKKDINKKASIRKIYNPGSKKYTYVLTYFINNNKFSKTFYSEKEVKDAQALYQRYIDDIENPLSETKAMILPFHRKKIKDVEKKLSLERDKEIEKLKDVDETKLDKLYKPDLINLALKKGIIKKTSQGDKMKKKDLLELIKNN